MSQLKLPPSEVDQFEKSLNRYDHFMKVLDAVGKLKGVDIGQDVNDFIEFMSDVKGFPFVSALIGLVQAFLPDEKHREIMNKLGEIAQSIQSVRRDIETLGHKITWEVAMGRYFDSEIVIKEGLKLLRALQTSQYLQDEKQRFIDFCKDGKVGLALSTLMAGLSGDSLFGGNMLEDLYNKTQGHKKAIAVFSGRLLQLIYLGMVMALKYDMMNAAMVGSNVNRVLQIGENANREQSKQMAQLRKNVHDVLQKCEINVRANMRRDIENVIDDNKGHPNRVLVDILHRQMTDKYGYCYISSVVYNDLLGSDEHCIGFSRVDVLHRNGKCAIVFYDDQPHGASKVAELAPVVDQFDTYQYNDAQKTFHTMVARIGSDNIAGLAVIKTGSDVFYMKNERLYMKHGSRFNFCLVTK